ncbi:MAG TPA: alpha/beta fold hydrolase, partial [Actinomycetota bacterium]|nr:alpha/beta fold hydrolase [Actinomycetota bacterium]
MAEFVIVHGGFGGGWEWTEVAKDLRSRGHEVYTPTLTGMGERSHLGPRIGLATHVEDVTSVMEYEDLRDVVLCGASYGGMAVTG